MIRKNVFRILLCFFYLAIVYSVREYIYLTWRINYNRTLKKFWESVERIHVSPSVECRAYVSWIYWRATSCCHVSRDSAVIFFVATFFRNGSEYRRRRYRDRDWWSHVPPPRACSCTPSRVIELTRLHQARGDSHISKLPQWWTFLTQITILIIPLVPDRVVSIFTMYVLVMNDY